MVSSTGTSGIHLTGVLTQVPPDSASPVEVPVAVIDTLRPALDSATEQLSDSLSAMAERVVDALNTPSVWDIGSSLAAIFVAILAVVEFRRLYRQKAEVQAHAAARVSAIAMPVHRQIKSWLDGAPPAVAQVEARHQQNANWTPMDATFLREAWTYWTMRSARGQIAKAEQRIEDLNAQAPLASNEVGDQVVRATAAFYAAFDHLNDLMAMPWQGDITANPPQAPHRKLVADGHGELRKCVEELVALIDKKLKA